MATGSASKLALWRRCRKKAYYHDMLNLQRIARSIAPSKGTLLHACLENYYTGKDWAEPIKNLTIDMTKVFDEEREEWAKLQEEAYRIMRGYIVAYRDIDAGAVTLGTELQFAIPVGNGHAYMGTIDRLYYDVNNIVWVQDHKCVKAIPQEKELYLDAQTLMYFDACRTNPKLQELIGGRKLGGVVFNHIRTKAPREPQILKNGTVSKAACDTDLATYFSTVKKAGLDPNDYADMVGKLKGNVFFKRTKIPIQEATLEILKNEANTTLQEIQIYNKKYEEHGDLAEHFFPRNMMKNRCAWDCEYYPICVGALAGMSVEAIIHEEYEKRPSRYDDEDYGEDDDA